MGAGLVLRVKMPVHSVTSTRVLPRHRRVLDRGHLDGAFPTLMVSPLTVTWPGKRPCTLSKRSRWALVSTGASR